ncbi:MAG TPA: nicotinate-nucleotide--dimethylbenzimidazole phosphoribosyltransferase [Solirubrobacteraceae bacterium]|nr:nicotinate-nucleotide--dimethylbenzimidazole phosphoribosyltransferase [Solirubrobacteraceae bacterium]
MPARFTRPPTPAGFDPSRAADRARNPQAWRYDDARRQAVYDVIAERRDVRRFRPDSVPDDVVERVLAAAHRAPSVGLMQPWRLIVIRDLATRSEIRRLAQRERIRQADRFDERARPFLDQKIEGVVEAPVGICVCCDHGDPAEEVLGRGTIPETDVYSTACAIQNLWLAARAEGLGVGWVSFYRPADLAAVLGLPERVEPIAYLCVGWPDEQPVRPTLEAVGWSRRLPLDAVVMRDRWHGPSAPSQRADGVDREAAIAARDRLDQLVKPAGSLGALEGVIERWALRTGAPPPERIRAGILVCAGDHGHLHRGTSLFGAPVSAQVAAAAARGETAAGVLAARGEHELIVADVGLIGETPAGVLDRKIAPGTADMTVEPALGEEQVEAALAAGGELAAELAARGIDCLVLGEIGIGNTTTTAALTCALTGAAVAQAVGRGTGLDAAGVDRKRSTVAAALVRHGQRLPPHAALQAVGGLELAALAGAALAAASLRLPVILDGYASAAAALAAAGLAPTVAEGLFAGHRSAEPGHGLVLAELGLEPLLDLRMRLGEASGALLALPLIEAAGALHRRMGTFEESGVSRPR